jgi:hypothetical protein
MACIAASELGRLRAVEIRVWPGLLWLLVILTWVSAESRGDWIDHHEDPRKETARVLRVIHARIDARGSGSDVMFANNRFGSIGPYTQSAAFPGWAAVFVIFFPENTVDGKAVHFVEFDRKTLRDAMAQGGQRIQSLLIGSDLGRAPER